MNPAGMRSKAFELGGAGRLVIYSDAGRIVVQMRRHVPTGENVLEPSWKVAGEISASQALSVAGELLACASRVLEKGREVTATNRGV